MVLDILFKIWRRLSAYLQWWFLWLFNAKFMVAVSGVVFDRLGHILLQRHRHWVPNVWGLPGGIVQPAETLESAFAREVLEETGLVVTDIVLIKVVSGYKLRMEAYFQANLESSGEPTVCIQKKEIAEARFFPLDELPVNILPLQGSIIEMAKIARLPVNEAME